MQGKENALQAANNTRQPIRQDKYRDNIQKLKEYVHSNPYIKLHEQASICRSFGLDYKKYIFETEYRNRFYDYLKKNVATTAMVSKATGIPEKLLCYFKAYYEKKGMLKVVYLGVCKTSPRSRDVQYLSTNPEQWDNTDLDPNSNQLKLFKS